MMHNLSKSTYMGGLQCLKKLYLNKHHRELKAPINESQEFVFRQGSRVGELAQEVFPRGEDCTPESFYDFGPSIIKTKDLIQSRYPVIYEAAFLHEGVLAALDILVLKVDGWHAYEVKSTNSTKSQHIEDSALQYWVITQSGIPLQSMNLMHFNPDYVRKGPLKANELFMSDDITSDVKKLQLDVPQRISLFRDTLEQEKSPNVSIGPHCKAPYDCDFRDYCWRNVPENSIFELNSGGKMSMDFYNNGISLIKDIPSDIKLTETQRVQVHSEKTGEAVIDLVKIQEFLSTLKYPLYYLDFETIMPGVPVYNDTRPYQHLCFQYSLHVQSKRGEEPKHFEYLGQPEKGDPRVAMLKKMANELGNEGSILVYHKSFEDARLREMMRDFKEFEEYIQNWRSRFVDLEDPFKFKYLYTKEMKGRSSIKSVLPALVPDLSYSDLNIQEGNTASRVYLQMVLGEFEGDSESTRNSLLEYCKLDTLAMVKLLEQLENTIK